MEEHDDAEKAEEVTYHSLNLGGNFSALEMPSDKEKTAAAASAASTRPKTTVAAAADSSRPSPKAAPTAASTTGQAHTTSAQPPATSATSGTSGSSSSGLPGTSRSNQPPPPPQPVVLNTLRDPSHYEELNVIGNGERLTETDSCNLRRLLWSDAIQF